MKRLTFSIALLLFSFNYLFSQNFHIITLGLNKYHNTLYDYKKNYGISLGYEFERKMNESVFLKAGFITNIAKEKNILVNTGYYQINDSVSLLTIDPDRTEESDGYSLSLQLPVNIKIKLHTGLFLTGGMMLSYDNFFIGTQIYSLDSETSRGIIGDLNKGPFTRLWGFGHQVGLIYEFSDRFGLFGEFKSSTNKNYIFNYFEFGLKIRMNPAPRSTI